MSELKLFLLDPRPIERQGIALLLDHQPGLTVVGQSENAAEAVAEIVQCKPDLIIIAPELLDEGGAGFVIELKKKGLPVNCLALAHQFNPVHFRMIMMAGAKGYVLKSSSVETLLLAIRMVKEGKVYLDPEIMSQCAEQVLFMRSQGLELQVE